MPGESESDPVAAQGGPRATAGIRDLAAHLGISIGTVSRALNGRPDVNAQTRLRVLAAAQALGYAPQQSGRSLRRGTTQTVGLLWEIPSGREGFGEPFFVSLFGAAQQVLSAGGYDLVIMPDQLDATPDILARLRRIIQRRQVDALLVPWTRAEDPRLDYLAAVGLPFVALGRSLSGGAHSWIDIDFETAAAQAVGRFLAAGHRRIGLGMPAGNLMQKRFFLTGYLRALQASGIAPDERLVAEGAVTPAGGHEIATKLLSAEPRPTAIMTIDSSMAVGIYRRLADLGLRCGEDVAVIAGVHDTPITQFLVPALTCFSLDLASLGRRLAELLLRQLEGQGAPVGELWPLTLIERQSDRRDAR